MIRIEMARCEERERKGASQQEYLWI